jgi:hypothetical protein
MYSDVIFILDMHEELDEIQSWQQFLFTEVFIKPAGIFYQSLSLDKPEFYLQYDDY